VIEALGKGMPDQQAAVCIHDSSLLTVTARGAALVLVERVWACPRAWPAYLIADTGGGPLWAGERRFAGLAAT
jgi:hypothetical protein